MKKLFINPGHSDRDPGAVGFVRERDLNVRTAEFMRKALEDYAVQTQVYSDDSLTKVCQKANEWDADLFVSIHFNAGGGDYPTFTLNIDSHYVDEHLKKLTGDRNLKKYVL